MVELKTFPISQSYDHLWQSLAEGFFVLNDEGTVTAANEAAALILGYTPEALIGQSYEAFWPMEIPFPDDAGAAESHKTELRQSDGRFISAHITIFPLNASGTRQKLVAISSLEQIQRFDDSLSHAQRLAGLGTLTAGVAHELVTPISIIANTCSNVQAEIEDDDLRVENLLRYIEIVQQSVWRCTRIMDVLRNYSFAETQVMTMTDLGTIVEDALTLVQHQFRGEFQIDVDVVWEQESKSIVCDHNRIMQMLINLLINARDAMQPDGGKIQIKSWSLPSLEYSPPPSEAVQSNGHTSIAAHAITVKDTGHGIDPAILDKIFDPFFTTKPSGQGTGLGLFLARRIVNQHNGRIWAQNNADGGATFTIILPRKQ